MKVCKKCLVNKPYKDFWKHSISKDWLRNICKECRKKEWSLYYKNNKEKRKDYYKNNKEKILNKNREWHENNKDKHKNLMKKWEENNKEKRKEIKKKFNQTSKWKISNRLKCAKRRKRKIWWDLPSNISYKYIEYLLKEQNYKCAISWQCLIKNWYHIDHIIPLSKWWLHSIENIQLLAPKINISKWNKIL